MLVELIFYFLDFLWNDLFEEVFFNSGHIVPVKVVELFLLGFECF